MEVVFVIFVNIIIVEIILDHGQIHRQQGRY